MEFVRNSAPNGASQGEQSQSRGGKVGRAERTLSVKWTNILMARDSTQAHRHTHNCAHGRFARVLGSSAFIDASMTTCKLLSLTHNAVCIIIPSRMVCRGLAQQLHVDFIRSRNILQVPVSV